jgi:hypothetical protein
MKRGRVQETWQKKTASHDLTSFVSARSEHLAVYAFPKRAFSHPKGPLRALVLLKPTAVKFSFLGVLVEWYSGGASSTGCSTITVTISYLGRSLSTDDHAPAVTRTSASRPATCREILARSVLVNEGNAATAWSSASSYVLPAGTYASFPAREYVRSSAARDGGSMKLMVGAGTVKG